MEPIETLQHHGLTINIVFDDNPINPRTDCDNAGRMICWHGKYKLGDEHDYADPDALLADLVREADLPDAAIRKLIGIALRDTYTKDDYRRNFRPYTREERRDQWTDFIADAIEQGCRDREEAWQALEDAGLVVLPLYVYEHGGITMNTGGFSCPWDSGQVGYIYCAKATVDEEWGGDRDKARKYLEGEVREYDQYLTGDIYGYRIEDDEGNDLDSCWGLYGLDYCRDEARSAAERAAELAGLQNGAGI
jgi:hypothetical protein